MKGLGFVVLGFRAVRFLRTSATFAQHSHPMKPTFNSHIAMANHFNQVQAFSPVATVTYASESIFTRMTCPTSFQDCFMDLPGTAS